MKKQTILMLIFACCAAGQSYEYDAAGRLVRVAYATGGGVEYRYDQSDNLLAVISLAVAPAPAGVEAVREGAAVRIQWRAVTGAQSYIVYRSGAIAGDWQEVGRVTGLSYVDAQVTAGQSYRYRIAAVTAAGPTAYSEEVVVQASTDLDPRSARAVALAPGGARTVTTAGVSAETSAGYATVSVQAGDTPYGLAVFKLTQNGVVVGETGVPATPPGQDIGFRSRTRLEVPVPGVIWAK